jgi:hypothetical protein
MTPAIIKRVSATCLKIIQLILSLETSVNILKTSKNEEKILTEFLYALMTFIVKKTDDTIHFFDLNKLFIICIPTSFLFKYRRYLAI